ncbi:hypothetical protein [Kitasatospora griseola]|uniref:hypothetical protein n=1 Tax=Kitasatospora griseola TaxID=2064 RepID=UPI0036688BE3
MNASTRRAAAILRQRRRDNKLPAGTRSMASHCTNAGLAPELAAGIGNALHSKAKQLALKPITGRAFRSTLGRLPGITGRRVHRYTPAQFLQALTAYNPRAPRLIDARNLLLAA